MPCGYSMLTFLLGYKLSVQSLSQYSKGMVKLITMQFPEILKYSNNQITHINTQTNRTLAGDSE
uniref:Uncharacterized protein n=1 Tax=Anguilla anguilla TaxID=7936 RepID=A0A0E9WQ00_ANGAN